ncbi:MAG: hypothetical protein AAFX53_15385 [Bacteroidota bacterium]
MKLGKPKFGKYFFEFTSVFFAVIAAFALDNWNDNRRDAKAEEKILMEIRSGLKSDLKDMLDSKEEVKEGLRACNAFREVIFNDSIYRDSLPYDFFYLTANSIPLINRSGYEGLKSKGLEIIRNDSLRKHIISIYEIDFEQIRKIEEESAIFQFYTNYGEPINQLLSRSFVFSKNSPGFRIEQPLKLNPQEKKLLLLYLSRIQLSRMSTIGYYDQIRGEIMKLIGEID